MAIFNEVDNYRMMEDDDMDLDGFMYEEGQKLVCKVVDV
jgi:hypothetical protein